MLTAKLRLKISEPKIFTRILNPDDTMWTKCWSDGEVLIIFAESDSTGAVLNALDDYMLNIKAAQALLNIL